MVSFGWATNMLGLFMCLALLLVKQGHGAGLEVPSAPFVELGVLSGDTIRAEFSPGNDLVGEDGSVLVTDGGSAIHSYKVEWDTDPGVQEVQTITTSTYVGTNEIQTIATKLEGKNEVQTVQTYSDEVQEVQKITIKHATSGSYFFLKLDTTNTGGSVQFSGDIPVNAEASGSGNTVAEIISEMSNIDSPVVVTSNIISEGTEYLVTFPASMGDVPTMEPFVDKLLPQGEATATVETVDHGNIISGTFRLSFEGATTDDIPFDATPTVMRERLEALPGIETVEVSVSEADNQRGYYWTIEFTGAQNDGNVVEDIKAVTTGLSVSNPVKAVNGARIAVTTVDGYEVGGTFTLEYNSEETAPISFEASAAEMKELLEGLPNDVIPKGSIAVSRTGPNGEKQYTWTVTFLNNYQRTHEGNLMPFDADFTALTPNGEAEVVVDELRKGTRKDVQTMTVSAAGGTIPDDRMMTLNFRNETTVPFRFHYDDSLGNPSCDSIVTEQQKITSSTLNTETTQSQGDGEVSTNLEFRLVYSTPYITETTGWIKANPLGTVDCSTAQGDIETELEKFTVFSDVIVTSSSAGVSMGCEWTIDFVSSIGDIPLLQIEAKNEESNNFGALGYTTTAGDDTIIVEEKVIGAKDVIKAALEELDTIGTVTVTVDGAAVAPDACVWKVTFDSNAGELDLLSVTIYDLGDEGNSVTDATYTNGGVSTGVAVARATGNDVSTSEALSGYFAMSFRGERTSYVRYDASARVIEQALETLGTVGDVAVFRSKAET